MTKTLIIKVASSLSGHSGRTGEWMLKGKKTPKSGTQVYSTWDVAFDVIRLKLALTFLFFRLGWTDNDRTNVVSRSHSTLAVSYFFSSRRTSLCVWVKVWVSNLRQKINSDGDVTIVS